MSETETATNPKGRFGMFEGVFTPCVLTILGVIMFMRVGFVVGHSGLWLGLVILLISKAITTLTTMSLSAISTNTEIKGGGVYYMISRVLGPEFGGTIGLTLFIANAVGVSFYVIGFTEAALGVTLPLINYLFSDAHLGNELISTFKVPQILSSLVVGGLFYLAYRGADLALKVQNYVFAILILSILSFLIGGVLNFNSETFELAKTSSFSGGVGFWVAFAIFFPAATGITAGANMSGDLKNPERSIPWGTLLAILFTFLVYLAQIFLMAGSVSREALKSGPFEALQQMSVFGPLVILGVFAATLSSALGSFLGAPRILQAMGRDRLMRVLAYFAKGVGPSDEPRRATILTFMIAVSIIWAGDLNEIAEIISMFFLIAYGMINLSAFVESRSGNPSFRPKFKFFHWSVALAGAVGCAIAMLKINDTYAVVALLISSIIYFYLKRQDIDSNFGDAKRGFIFKSVRDNLRLLEGSKVHPKNWRPILVVVADDFDRDVSLLRMGAWIESERGLYTVLNVSEVKGKNYIERIGMRESKILELASVKQIEKISAFSECLITENYHEGIFNFMQSHSLGELKANSVMLKAPLTSDSERWDSFLKSIDIIASFNTNLLVFLPGKPTLEKKRRTIDLWWRCETNGSLMALFAYLITLSPSWTGALIRLMVNVSENQDQETVMKEMLELKRLARLDAEIKIVPTDEVRYQVIKKLSLNADLVLLGMGAINSEEARQSLNEAGPLMTDFPPTLLVWSNGEANIFA